MIEDEAALAARGMLFPEGTFRVAFNFIMVLAVLFTVISVPLVIGFNIDEPAGYTGFNYFITALFFADIVFTFRTPLPVDDSGDGRVTTVPSTLLRRYVAGSLFIDLVSTIPFDDIVAAAARGGGSDDGASSAKLTRVLRLIRLVRLIRLARLSSLTRMLPSLDRWIVKNPRASFVTSAMMQLLFVMHLLACAFAWMVVVGDEDSRSWWATSVYADQNGNMRMNPDQLPEPSLGSRYLAAFYWAASTATTTGVGDIAPATDLQRAYNALAIVIGVLFYAYIAGLLAGVVSQGIPVATRNALSSADHAARSVKLPPTLRRRLLAYDRMRMSFTTPIDEDGLLADVPFTLRKELVIALHSRSPVPASLMGSAAAAAAASAGSLDGSQLLYDCLSQAKPRWAATGDAIVFEGASVDEIIVVASGSISVTDASVAHDSGTGKFVLGLHTAAPSLSDEAASSTSWPSTVVAASPCFLWVLPADHVRGIAAKNEAVAAHAEAAAAAAAATTKGPAVEAMALQVPS